MKRCPLVLAVLLGVALFMVVGPVFAESVSGTLKAVTIEGCDFLPGTCQGALVVESGGQTLTFLVAKGTFIEYGDRHWVLIGELRPPDPVTITYVIKDGRRLAKVVRLERRPLPGEMQTD